MPYISLPNSYQCFYIYLGILLEYSGLYSYLCHEIIDGLSPIHLHVLFPNGWQHTGTSALICTKCKYRTHFAKWTSLDYAILYHKAQPRDILNIAYKATNVTSTYSLILLNRCIPWAQGTSWSSSFLTLWLYCLYLFLVRATSGS